MDSSNSQDDLKTRENAAGIDMPLKSPQHRQIPLVDGWASVVLVSVPQMRLAYNKEKAHESAGCTAVLHSP